MKVFSERLVSQALGIGKFWFWTKTKDLVEWYNQNTAKIYLKILNKFAISNKYTEKRTLFWVTFR